MTSPLLNSPNYNSEYSIIMNSFIYEYDISKANINALLQCGVISKELYDNLYNSDKAIREKHIGLMIRKDANIYNYIKNSIMEAKSLLIKNNNLQIEDIVSIKNDAVFVINKKLNHTKFNLMDFKLKNTYTLFLKIKNYEFYYYYNSYTNEENLDVKGISDSKLVYHKDYFMDFLLSLFNTLQLDGVENAINMIIHFSKMYLSRELNINYYRTFNSDSNLYYNNATIDFNYNYQLIRDIYSVLVSYYFRKIKG